MGEVRTRIRVGSDHRISGVAPAQVPPGDHEITISIAGGARLKKFRLADMPVHDAMWDSSVSLRRETIYGDDGR